jgi:chromosome segregation ATPase
MLKSIVLWVADLLRRWADPTWASDLAQLEKDRAAWEQAAASIQQSIISLQEEVVRGREIKSQLETQRARLSIEADQLRSDLLDLEKQRGEVENEREAKRREIEQLRSDDLLHGDLGLGPANK